MTWTERGQGKRGTSRVLKHAYNWTFGWLFANYDMSAAADDIVVPLNAARLIDELFQVHGHEVLIDGCFNADPHPGNVFVMDDGRVGLLRERSGPFFCGHTFTVGPALYTP